MAMCSLHSEALSADGALLKWPYGGKRSEGIERIVRGMHLLFGSARGL